MLDKKKQEEIFISIGTELRKPLEVYAIGGTAMILRGFKETTLDIDLVFSSKKDREKFMQAAKQLGFKEKGAIQIYGLREDAPLMMDIPNGRFDLFLKKVISSTFSENMKNRANETHEFGKHLLIKPANLHDILIMKSATSRIKDEEDIVSIINNIEIDWNIIIEEAKHQIELGNETAILSLGTLLEKLQNKQKIPVPKSVLNTLWNLMKKQVKPKTKKRPKT